MMRRLLPVGALCLAPIVLAAQDASPTVSPAQFRQLRWVIGQWKGSGGGYAAFYESYDMVDDSTMRRYSWSDSTFTRASDSARFELRGGKLSQVRNGRAFPALKFTGDTVQWRPPSATWIRTSKDSWTAILAGGGTVYTLVRHKR